MANKESLTRFGVSMPVDLISQFDERITQQGYNNRSEAIRDLIRRALLEPNHINIIPACCRNHRSRLRPPYQRATSYSHGASA